MYLSTFVCMYVLMHVCVLCAQGCLHALACGLARAFVYICVCFVRAQVFACVCRMCVHVHLCLFVHCVCLCKSMCICVCMCMFVCVHLYVCVHTCRSLLAFTVLSKMPFNRNCSVSICFTCPLLWWSSHLKALFPGSWTLPLPVPLPRGCRGAGG